MPLNRETAITKQELESEAFPKLDQAQLDAFESCPLTMCRRYKDGEVRYRPGEVACKFHVVQSGKVEFLKTPAVFSFIGAVPRTDPTGCPARSRRIRKALFEPVRPWDGRLPGLGGGSPFCWRPAGRA